MRFYKQLGSKGYEGLSWVDSQGFDVVYDLDGSSRAEGWKPLAVRRVRPSRREACRPADSPYYGTDILVLRRSAVDALRDMLEAHGELLPLEDEGGGRTIFTQYASARCLRS